MTSISNDVAAPPVGRPYGLVGMVLGLIAILIVTVLLFLLAVAAGLGLATLVIGGSRMVDRLTDLTAYAEADTGVREKLMVLLSLVIYAALSLAVLIAARVRGGALWRDVIGWIPWHPLRGARWVWGLAVLTVLYSLGADATVTHFAPGFHDLVHMPQGVKWVAIFVLLASVFAPIAEELLFRGWIYTSLRGSFGVAAALLVSSVLFAAAHWESTHLYALAVFPVGLALGYIRERAGSIKASMTVHGFYNAIASLLLLFGH